MLTSREQEEAPYVAISLRGNQRLPYSRMLYVFCCCTVVCAGDVSLIELGSLSGTLYVWSLEGGRARGKCDSWQYLTTNFGLK